VHACTEQKKNDLESEPWCKMLAGRELKKVTEKSKHMHNDTKPGES